MRVLMLTSVWPTPDHPEHAPFVVRQAEFLRKQGVAVDVFHVDGRKDPAAYFRAWLKVQRSIASGSYNLVHAQWAQAALPALPVHLPLVVTFRGSDVEGIVRSDHRYAASGWVLRNVARGVARLATEAILVASRLARLLPSRDYHIIPSGLDLDLFSPRPQLEARALLSLLPGRRYVLFAGAPNNPVKRFSLARSVVESLHPRFRAELLVAETVEPSRMPLLMSACDALLLTSVHEGSPNVVKEALACNLPVVSTDVGDVRERISHVEGCALCASDDAHVLAAALAAVLDRGNRVEGRTAVKDLDESLLTRKVIAVYERALARKACRILQTT